MKRIALVLSLSLVLPSCGDNSDGVCDPGRQDSCPCPGAPDGIQVCLENGSGWGECQCGCTPDCTDRCCGDDGCGGTCPDACDANQTCDPGTCFCEGPCVTDCAGKVCGGDGCGGTCDPGCQAGETCNALGQCEACTPDCVGRECGDDGCGGTCDPGCQAGRTCNASGQCNPNCGDGSCDAGETCGSCPEDCDPCGGWPGEVPQPWAGWDVLPANSNLLANTDGNDMSVTCTGTPGNPAGLTAGEVIVGTANGNVTITASYCVIHDIQFEGYQVRVDGDHYVIRDCDIDGAGRTTKNGLSLSGDNGVAYRVRSHHLLGNDRHCFTNGQGATDMWFIECEGFYCTGDGYQAGHQADGNRPTNIYLVRNHMHDNRENGLDYKFVQNLWAVENTLHGFANASDGEPWCFPDDPTVCENNLTSGSDGSAVVVGSDGGPIDTYHYRNTIYDSVHGIRVEEALGDIHIEGNEVHDLSGTCLALDKEGLGIQYLGNTCRNAARGIFQNWRVNFGLDVADNTFENISGNAIEYEQGEVIDRSTLTDNAFIGSGPVVYNNDVATTEAEINALPGASGNTVSP